MAEREMACHQARSELVLPLPIEGVEQRDSHKPVLLPARASPARSET
jgi:hypothetical protein